MKKIVHYIALCLILLGLCSGVSIQAEAAEKQTIYNSPYVTFSPDGKAWTTHAGETNYSWTPMHEKVVTGIQSSLRALDTGEHYYQYKRADEVPIGYWRVEHRTASCIHSKYPYEDNYHGLPYGKHICGKYYFSGWEAYCADCGDKIADILMYMSREAAASIDYMPLKLPGGGPIAYYYLCPWCNNLEQGVDLPAHYCKAISNNRYKVIYEPNVTGIEHTQINRMGYSVHMYDNATIYEGETVTPVTHLTPNAYERVGYVFTAWNTKPDGSGTSYTDGQEILNLTSKNCDNLSDTTDADGVVILYAQWRTSKSTLRINPNGGVYGGKSGVTDIEQEYGKSYVLGSQTLVSPAGYTVSFETNGGAAVAPITGTTHFTEWKMEQPFRGNMYNQGTAQEKYLFSAPDGNIDTLTAQYEADSITLPGASKPGYSFGGWYEDPDLKIPAGGEGDVITPIKNTTLYAQWVDLKLQAKDNYRANGGKGAVDLSWSQADGNNKVYMLYQSRDGVNWTKINDSTDIGNAASVNQTYAYSGSIGSYTVPYAGIYSLTAVGARGGNSSGYSGGYGGLSTMQVWLSKGEILSFAAGGINGYNCGGSGSTYGNGGGMTNIISNKKGVLLIGAGGGGASPAGNGGAGGSTSGLSSVLNQGQSGMTGGGAGYYGGKQGEYIVHTHNSTCYASKTIAAPTSMYKYADDTRSMSHVYSDSHSYTSTYAECGGHSKDGRPYFVLTAGNRSNYISIPEPNGKLSFYISPSCWGDAGIKNVTATVYFVKSNGSVSSKTYNMDNYNPSRVELEEDKENHRNNEHRYYTDAEVSGQRYWKPQSNWVDYGPTYRSAPEHDYYYITILTSVPSDAIGAYVSLATECNVGTKTGVWASARLSNIQYSYTATVCGYSQGQIVSAKPGFGGSNYVNTAYARSYSTQNGVQNGNGYLTIRSESIGFNENLYLNDVTATDYAKPDSVDGGKAKKNAGTENQITVSWEAPADNGTVYYHKAESYLAGSTNILCTSNVTTNTLTSGVKGYYALIDRNAYTTVTASNASFQSAKQIVATLTEAVQYLHLAAVDVAGNVSDTTHINLGAKGKTDVAWNLYTRQMTIEEGENVYPAEAAKTYYVRSDGTTPIQLQMSGYVDGTASKEYQPNYSIFETQTDGVKGRNIAKTGSMDIANRDIRTDAKDLTLSVDGQSYLIKYPYAYTVRSNQNVELSYVQKFTVDTEASGKTIDVLPIMGAYYGKNVIYSDYSSDQSHGIRIIADGEAPVITGLEILDSLDLINKSEQTIHLNVTAADDLSGVKDFYVKIVNTDNVVEKTYTPGADGSISIDITADEPIFSGDFIVTAHAVDNVGNEREVSSGTTEFALTAHVERILEPHDPIFKRGESGVLTFTTWGYAEKVEVIFPAEMTALDPSLNKTYVYTDTPAYVHEESLQFMIPLYAPEDSNFEITIKAYKGDKKLEEHPAISTISVGGTVLDEIRTRLR